MDAGTLTVGYGSVGWRCLSMAGYCIGIGDAVDVLIVYAEDMYLVSLLLVSLLRNA